MRLNLISGGQLATRYPILGGLALALGLGMSVAQAQQADTRDEVIVTGSRIARPEIESPSPVQTIDNLDIQLSGAVNVENFLNTLPQALPGTFSSTTNNGSDGTSSVNLRGLGDERTLVLVNGKRFIPKDGTLISDLNVVPVGLIDHVEIVTGGTSATYGSDAMAGVVNAILKKDFEGVELGGQYLTTNHADGTTRDLNALLGTSTADGKGNVTAFAGYTRRSQILSSSRGYSSQPLVSNLDLTGLEPVGSANAVPINIVYTEADYDNPIYDLNGDGLISLDANGNIQDVTNDYNYAASNFLLQPQERYQLGTIGHYELRPEADLYLQAVYANNTVSSQLAPTATFFDEYYVNPGNPFISQTVYDAIVQTSGGVTDFAGNPAFYPGRRFVENGYRSEQDQWNAFQIEAGVRGQITETWTYDTFFQRSQSDTSSSLQNDFNATRLQQGLLAVDNGNGPECVDPSNGCVPIDIWSGAPLSPEAVAFIHADAQTSNRTRQTIYGANATGDLGPDIRIARDPIGVSVGYEYREVSADYRTDDCLANGNCPGYGTTPSVSGQFDVHELYAETNIPLVQDRPWVRNLNVEAGYRWSNYSTAADTVGSYKLGAAYSPVDEVKFRGMYQRAVRAPNINELYQPATQSAESISADPCAGPNPTASQALCEATGVPSGSYGAVTAPPSGQINGILGGNTALKEETSDTYTFGVVLQPAPGLNATVDYYSIKVNDAIDVLGGTAQAVIDGCYTISQDPNSPFCQAIRRNPATGVLFGQEAEVLLLNANLGYRKTTGTDFFVDYRVEPDFMPGSLGFQFNGTYVFTNKFKADDVSPARECAGTYGSTCLEPDPEFRFQLRTLWENNGLTLSALVRYLGSVKLDALEFGEDAYSSSQHIGAKTYLDLAAIYDVNEHVQVTAGVDNALDRDPPVLDSDTVATPTTNGNGNTFPATYDALGRIFFAGARVKF